MATREDRPDYDHAISRLLDAGEGLGEPLAVSIDFQGTMFVADGIPSRIVRIDPDGLHGLEFQSPAKSPGFFPSDCRLQGFFLYVVDEVNRTILRFDKNGAYRDMLLVFGDEPVGGGRVF